MGAFDELVKAAGNDYAAKVSDGNDADVETYVDTGSYSLNAGLSGSIYGGFAGNKVSALAGEPATGKTFYALNVCKEFLDKNSKGGCVYFESESAVTTEMITSRGIDPARIYIVPVITVQEFRTQCVRIINAYLEQTEKQRQPMLMVLDSLGNLSTTKEMEDVTAGSETKDMTRAQLIRGTFRVLTLKLGRAKIPLVVTNHTYDGIGMYATKTMSGGDGLKYAASTIVFLSKSKKRESDQTITGAIITCKMFKSRLTIENKEVETLLDYQKGLDRYYGLIDIAEKAGIVKRISKKVEFPGMPGAFENAVYKNPEKYFTKEILDQIDAACKKEFSYGAPLADVVEEE